MSVVVAFLVLAAVADPASIWRDMIINPTSTPGPASQIAADLAPVAGLDVAIVVIIAAIVVGVVLAVLRARRGRR
jgi:hypothetical protein